MTRMPRMSTVPIRDIRILRGPFRGLLNQVSSTAAGRACEPRAVRPRAGFPVDDQSPPPARPLTRHGSRVWALPPGVPAGLGRVAQRQDDSRCGPDAGFVVAGCHRTLEARHSEC